MTGKVIARTIQGTTTAWPEASSSENLADQKAKDKLHALLAIKVGGGRYFNAVVSFSLHGAMACRIRLLLDDIERFWGGIYGDVSTSSSYSARPYPRWRAAQVEPLPAGFFAAEYRAGSDFAPVDEEEVRTAI